ncbi:methyltransferase [Elusimicrobiota bacterium]
MSEKNKSVFEGLFKEDKPIQHFNELVWAYAASGVVMASCRLEVFSILEAGALTAKEISKKCKADHRAMEKLLIACVALGLARKDGEKYRNSSFAKEYLVKGKQAFQGSIIEHHRIWEHWQNLDLYVRTGVRQDTRLSRAGRKAEDRAHKMRHREWILGMHNIAMAGQAKALCDVLDLKGKKQLLDVGGGPGSYSIALCFKFPKLKATVFDLPETLVIARETIRHFKITDRVRTTEGDFLKDSYGSNNDVVLLSSVLHGELAAHCKIMFKKAFDSMVKGGIVVAQETFLNDNKTGPLMPAIFNLHMAHFGASYTSKEIMDFAKSVGFAEVKFKPVEGYGLLNGVVIGKKL